MVYGDDYEPCIVSFIDILGFKNLVASSESRDIAKVIEHVRMFAADDKYEQPRRMKEARLYSQPRAVAISDAIVRLRPFHTQFRDGAFGNELTDLAYAQMKLVGEGVFIRGGLTIGRAYVSDFEKDKIFGPALVRAYEIESGEAIYPRIVIDGLALHQYRNDPQLWYAEHAFDKDVEMVKWFISADQDGACFIDYLRAAEKFFDDPEIEYIPFLERHRDLVSKNLIDYADHPRILGKYRWVRNYHNRFVRTLDTRIFRNRDQLLITLSDDEIWYEI